MGSTFLAQSMFVQSASNQPSMSLFEHRKPKQASSTGAKRICCSTSRGGGWGLFLHLTDFYPFLLFSLLSLFPSFSPLAPPPPNFFSIHLFPPSFTLSTHTSIGLPESKVKVFHISWIIWRGLQWPYRTLFSRIFTRCQIYSRPNLRASFNF